MDRRKFFEISGAALVTTSLAGLAGCFELNESGAPEPDIILTGDSADDAGRIKKVYNRIKEIAQNPGENMRVGLLGDNGEIRILDFFRSRDSGDISVFDEDTGKLAVLGFGWKLISPSIKFMDEKGNLLRDFKGNEMEYALFGPNFNLAPAREKTDWFMIGVKAAALGLGIWLGAEILGLVLSAVSFIAYYAMILALIIAGIGGAQWLLDTTGWNFDKVKDFFGKKTEEIRDFIGQVAAAF